MTINSAMQSGITALAANSTALATISNNIANSNTTGYKRVLTNFTDLVSGSSNKSSFTSGGVVSVNRQTATSQGELNTANTGYSMGVNGQGFFVVSGTPTAVSASSALLFTRDGSFTTDTAGNLVNAGGFYLQGWPANSSGDLTTSSTDVGLLSPINVTALSKTAEKTTKIAFDANLDSKTTISTAGNLATGTYDPTAVATSMTGYDASIPTGTKPDTTITASISDSLGQEHTLTVSLIKRGIDPTTSQSEWDYEISSPDIVGGTNMPSQVSSGKLFFDAGGKLDIANSTGGLKTGITIGASAATSGVQWKSGFGAGAQSIGFGIPSDVSTDTITYATPQTSTLSQLSEDSTTKSISANGTEFGTLSKVQISASGLATAIYSNGNSRTLAQIALATFINANGLTAVSGNAYQVSTDSGTFSLKIPGQSGAGEVKSDTLEASTVDLAQEFTGLITTQRAYSAASKIVTTADQMLQELLSIKQ